jgi:hypothetical protein
MLDNKKFTMATGDDDMDAEDLAGMLSDVR